MVFHQSVFSLSSASHQSVIPAQAGIQKKPTTPQMHIYILASKRNGTLYTGVTNDLERRIVEHKTKLLPGFTEKYEVTKLVYCEEIPSATSAIAREKQIKKWNRKWKLRLIEERNPEWKDLSEEWMETPPGSPPARG